MAEWLKAADCKSADVRLRRFESYPLHHSDGCVWRRGSTPAVMRFGFVGKFDSSYWALGGCSSMVERQPSKLDMWVRFPSPAPLKGLDWQERTISCGMVGASKKIRAYILTNLLGKSD